MPVNSSRVSAMAANSSTVSPAMLTIAGTSQEDQIGGHFRTNAARPGFCSPTALSTPAGVSMRRGIELPERGRSVMVLQTKAPRRWTSTMPAYSRPKPKQPEAAMTGLANRNSHGLLGARSTASETTFVFLQLPVASCQLPEEYDPC